MTLSDKEYKAAVVFAALEEVEKHFEKRARIEGNKFAAGHKDKVRRNSSSAAMARHLRQEMQELHFDDEWDY